MYSITRRIVCIILGMGILLAVVGSPALAQDPPYQHPNAVVRVDEFPPTGQSYLTVIGPDGSNPGKLIIDSSMNAQMSPDGQWMLSFGYDSTQQVQVLEYRRVNGRPVQVSVEAGFDILNGRIGSDGRYGFYTLAKLEPRQWILGLIELETGKVVELTGPADEKSPIGENLIADIIHFDGQRLVLSAYLPYAGGNFGGFYAMNVPGIQDAQAGRYPMPTLVTPLLRGVAFAIGAVSPDGRLVAYLYFNPNNPPQGYQAEGPSFTLNALAVLDLETGASRTIAQAGIGQGLEQMSWAPGSAQILFTGGNFQNSYWLVRPNLYAVHVLSGAVTEIGPLNDDPAEAVTDLLVCGNTVFFVTSKADEAVGRITTLYSAPRDALAARNTLVAGSWIRLDRCAEAVN